MLIFMRNGRKSPDVIIDAKKIPELTRLDLNPDSLTIGAAVSCRTIWEDPEITGRFPALADAATLIGGIQIQGRATFGGNLCNAAPSADTVPPVIVYGATAHIVSARGRTPCAGGRNLHGARHDFAGCGRNPGLPYHSDAPGKLRGRVSALHPAQ